MLLKEMLASIRELVKRHMNTVIDGAFDAVEHEAGLRSPVKRKYRRKKSKPSENKDGSAPKRRKQGRPKKTEVSEETPPTPPRRKPRKADEEETETVE